MSDMLRFTYTPEDYVAANKLHVGSALRSWRMARVFIILWAIYLTIVIAIDRDLRLVTLAIDVGATFAVSAAILAVIIGMSYLLIPRRSKRIFAQQRSLHGEITVGWDAAGIAFDSLTGTGRHHWHDFVKYAENDRMLLLYQSDALFNMLPKHALGTAHCQEIVSALSAANVRRIGRKPR